jgi:hypothetical protein
MNHSTELPTDFNSDIYYELHPDVKSAGIDAKQHYLNFGKSEGRVYKHICGSPSDADIYLHNNSKTKRSTIAKHENIWEWVRSVGANKNFRVLEIGSRSVVSNALWKSVIPNCDYTGFDVLAGENVDVVGDAHRLSEYFKPQSFDLVISFAVFEHLAMPWIVAEEISKVLDIGGFLCAETHFSFSEHELPWHFFQFNNRALELLFCPELGFEIIDSGLDNPIVGRFSQYSSDYLRGRLVSDLYCHSSIIVKKIRSNDLKENEQFDWRNVALRVCKESMYPNKVG